MPITTEVMSSNPAHGELYSIYYVMKFVSDLRNVGGFLCVTEILLKVSLNKLTVTQTHTYDLFFSNNNPDTKQQKYRTMINTCNDIMKPLTNHYTE